MSIDGSKGDLAILDARKNLIENDPIEEIFALNLGDFLTEDLFSDDLLSKISKATKDDDKVKGLKNQLKELISIYSLDNTLILLGFNSEDDFIIYNSIAKTLSQMLEVKTCSIWLTPEYTTAGDKITLSGCSEENLKGTSENIMNHISACLEAKETLVVNENDKTITIVPMVNNYSKVGVIYIENDKSIISEYMSLVEITAKLFVTSMRFKDLIGETELALDDDFATSMELRQLRAELTAIIGDLGGEQQQFVESLATATDAKGHYEKEHSFRIAEFARQICNQLSLNEKTTDLIYYAAMLQNIGKITLPEEVFSKKEKLSKEDWQQLQNHPNIGVNLLMKINFLSEVIPYIHYHKERWDGKGMPEGLSGFSIPLGSRIIAVADAYQAMVCDRPHRKAMSKHEAFKIIKEESGTKWDPAIIEVLSDII